MQGAGSSSYRGLAPLKVVTHLCPHTTPLEGAKLFNPASICPPGSSATQVPTCPLFSWGLLADHASWVHLTRLVEAAGGACDRLEHTPRVPFLDQAPWQDIQKKEP